MNLAAGVLAWTALGWRDRLSVLRLGPALQAPADPRQTVREWLTAHGQGARVILDGRDLGLYALKEAIDRDFLGRFFDDSSGNLYDGGAGVDLDEVVQQQHGHDPPRVCRFVGPLGEDEGEQGQVPRVLGRVLAA